MSLGDTNQTENTVRGLLSASALLAALKAAEQLLAVNPAPAADLTRCANTTCRVYVFNNPSAVDIVTEAAPLARPIARLCPDCYEQFKHLLGGADGGQQSR